MLDPASGATQPPWYQAPTSTRRASAASTSSWRRASAPSIVRLGTDRRPGTWWPGVLNRIARSGLDGTGPVVEALSAR